jgi:6-pyruvoyltetrahydropterin/6-carboxytetrahydropterin synthase
MKIHTEVQISSAHHLPGYPYECQKVHGHNWKVVIEVTGDILDEHSMLLDFKKIKEVMKKYDHADLNDLIEMPTAENLSYKFASEIRSLGSCKRQISASGNFMLPESNRFNSVTVRVYEAENSYAEITL